MYLRVHTGTSVAFCEYINKKSYAGWRRPTGCLNCRSFFAKKLLIIGLFCGKSPIKIRHTMTLCHPVARAVIFFWFTYL